MTNKRYDFKVVTSMCPKCFGKTYSNDGINWECGNKKCGKKISLYNTKRKMWV